MKLINCTLGLILTGSLVLTVSCGDEGTADKGGAGTGNSAGGNASGGTLGTTGGSTSGGSVGTTGGSAGTANTTGGTANTTGGTSATGGSAGTGTTAPGCPASAPGDGDTCNPDDTDGACRYVGLACTCGGGFQGGGGAPGMSEWNCMGDGADCPTTAPMDGDDCDPNPGAAGGGNGGPGGGGLNCPYPTTTCTCGGFGNNPTWNCNDVPTPVTCPDTAPEDGSPCTGTGACPDIMCGCFNEEWNCFGGGFGGAPG